MPHGWPASRRRRSSIAYWPVTSAHFSPNIAFASRTKSNSVALEVPQFRPPTAGFCISSKHAISISPENTHFGIIDRADDLIYEII
jgi:hypothetical protein